MLSQRKRFNYMVNNGCSAPSRSQQKKTTYTPISSANKNYQEPTVHYTRQDKENRQAKENHLEQTRKIEELQKVNKKLVDETAKQFKKLESDVQRVEKILCEKETALEEAKQENQKVKEEVNKIADEKKILIEAIFEKDMVIKEYEMKLKQMIEEQAHTQNTNKQDHNDPQQEIVEKEEKGMQTDVLPETCPKSEVTNMQRHNLELEDEVYRLKEELFDASNKVKLITQEFEAYKILKEIEHVQES